MKTIGLLGGMSWESTVTYYQTINELVKQRLGGLHSAKLLLYSVDFAELESRMSAGDWEGAAAILCDAAQRLKAAGADFLIICTNTLHKVAPQIERTSGLPVLHIAHTVAWELKAKGVTRAALLGTRFTMEQDFYKEILRGEGIEVLLPNVSDRAIVDRVIFQELCLGVVSDASRKEYLRIINQLADAGAQGVIFGCTELGLLVHPKDCSLPVFDSAVIHSAHAARLALEE